jgi:alpha-tubulin suppressor-like RCC1 family protein
MQDVTVEPDADADAPSDMTGDPDAEDTDPDAPERACWLHTAAGEHHTCAIDNERYLYCWGYNDSGQLGVGTLEPSAVTLRVGSENGWASVAAGWLHTCAIGQTDLRYGRLFCWGLNAHGQLGIGTTEDALAPVQTGTDADWMSVSCGYGHTCGVKEDGRLFCWGLNEDGQLGTGSGANARAPVRVGTDDDWFGVAAGHAHTCAVRSDGLYCWGSNMFGQVGDGTTDRRTRPVLTAGNQDGSWGSVAAGYGHTCAILSLYIPDPNGLLYCWGYNQSGQVGDGTFEDRNEPVRVGDDMDWMTPAAGYGHSCGVKMDGDLFCWGYAEAGRLCSDLSGDQSAPLLVGSGYEWLSVTAGMSHTCAVRYPFQLSCCGYNEYGQIGDGTHENRFFPTRVPCP